MAAGVSSSPRPAYLHHPLSHTTTNDNTSPTAFNSCSSSSSSSSSSSPTTEPEASPSYRSSISAATTPILSLPACDSSDKDSSRPSHSPHGSTSSSSTPATSPVPPHSPLEPVAEAPSSHSPAFATSNSLGRYRSQQLQQLGGYSTRGDPKSQRSGGFFAFAVSAIDRTQSAIATISDPNIRHKRSLSRLSITGDVTALSRGAEPSPDKFSRYRPASVISSSSSANVLSSTLSGSKSPSSQASPAQETPYSQPYSETDASQPPPILLPRIDNKMHQTSSRLLRMTDDDRPFTKVSQSTFLICCT